VIQYRGLQKSLQSEIDRLNKMGLIDALLIINGDTVELDNPKDDIILFRILQEFIANTIKYADAKRLKITLNYLPSELYVEANEDGKGFNIEAVEQGSGLISMKNRAALVNAQYHIDSNSGKGVTLGLHYPFREEPAIPTLKRKI